MTGMARVLRIIVGLALAGAAALSVGAAAAAQQPAPGPAEQAALSRLASPKASVRRDAVQRLGELKSRAASGEIAMMAASDPDPPVRRAAVVALGRIRDESRIPDMIAVLKDPEPKVRLGAIEGLVNLYLDRDERFFTRVRSGVIRIIPFWDERQTATVEPWVAVDPRVTRAIGDALRQDKSEDVRTAAARALGALGARSEIETMADAMAADTRVRPEVLDAFVLIGDPEAAKYATPLFESPDVGLAAQAMIVAGRLRAAGSVAPLLAVYGSEEPNLGILETVKRKVTFAPERRKAAFQALALIGDPRAEEVFRKNLYDKDADIRRAANEGLGRMRDPRFFDMVARNKLIEKDRAVRLAQVFAIYKMNHPEVFGNFIDALRDGSLRDQANQYLLEADSPAHLLPHLRTRHEEVQRMVIDALGQIGDLAAAGELRPFERETPPEIRQAASLAIRRIEWRARKAAGGR